MATDRTYDVIVIGAGAVGENVADYAHRGGLSVIVVENELVGGECSYWACMPSKALLRSGIAVRAAQRVGGAKQAVTSDLDVPAVLARRDSFTSNWDDASQVEWLQGAGIDLIRGLARIAGQKTVVVKGQDGSTTTLTATVAVAVATGSAPMVPDLPGLTEVQPWTSREVTSAHDVPKSLAIIGGGVVACEMATAYATFGAAVTMLVRGDALLDKQEPFAGELVAASLTELGVEIRTGVSAIAAERDTSTQVRLTLDDDSELTAAEVLVATGRSPRTADLGLETVGLSAGDWLSVDDTMLVRAETNKHHKWLYAVGDVNHRALLTHQGKYQARAVGDVLAARARDPQLDTPPWSRYVASADQAAVPQVTFTDPEVAAVGLTAAAADQSGYPIRVVDFQIGQVAGASVHADGYTGQARIVVDTDREVLLGATFVGPDVAELLHAATIAVVGEVPISRLWHAVPSYPTISEVWLRLLDSYGRPQS